MIDPLTLNRDLLTDESYQRLFFSDENNLKKFFGHSYSQNLSVRGEFIEKEELRQKIRTIFSIALKKRDYWEQTIECSKKASKFFESINSLESQLILVAGRSDYYSSSIYWNPAKFFENQDFDPILVANSLDALRNRRFSMVDCSLPKIFEMLKYYDFIQALQFFSSQIEALLIEKVRKGEAEDYKTLKEVLQFAIEKRLDQIIIISAGILLNQKFKKTRLIKKIYQKKIFKKINEIDLKSIKITKTISDLFGEQFLLILQRKISNANEVVFQNIQTTPMLEELRVCQNLKKLSLIDCPSFKMFYYAEELEFLEELSLHSCLNLSDHQFEKLAELKHLKKISIFNCPGIKNLSSLKNSKSLRKIRLENCSNLTSIAGFQNNKILEEVEIVFCPKLQNPRFADQVNLIVRA